MNKYWKWIPANEKHALRRFGVKTYQPRQRELIQAVLSGNDALGIMPTGNGKSLCYQLPALFLPYAVLVGIAADTAHNEEIKRDLVGDWCGTSPAAAFFTSRRCVKQTNYGTIFRAGVNVERIMIAQPANNKIRELNV